MAGSQKSGRRALTRGINSCLLVIHLISVMSGLSYTQAENPTSTVGAVWPRPQSQVVKDEYVVISDNFKFKVVSTLSGILNETMKRYMSLLATSRRHVTTFDLVNTSPNIVGNATSLKINLKRTSASLLDEDMDEKYTLVIKKGASLLTADTIWGIMRGLETFSQLPGPNKDRLIMQVQKIEDFPLYPHRGLLIDTSRHLLPLETIKRQLDIMSYNKMNVLHWHLVPPYKSRKFPEVKLNGPTYTIENIKEVGDYARERGIRVIRELNISIIPMDPKDPMDAMNPFKTETYEIMNDVFSNAIKMFLDNSIHLGGQGVNYSSWSKDFNIGKIIQTKGWDMEKLQYDYMQKIYEKSMKSFNRAIVWEDVFNNWKKIDDKKYCQYLRSPPFYKDIIVHLYEEVLLYDVDKITSLGYKVIVSNGWYLDDKEIFDYYHKSNLGTAVDSKGKISKKFLGGEACMRAENMDETKIDSLVWPRACAIAEHLWSTPIKGDTTVPSRITEHVCRLRRRGVQASAAYEDVSCSKVLPWPSYNGDDAAADDEDDDDGDDVKDSTDSQRKYRKLSFYELTMTYLTLRFM